MTVSAVTKWEYDQLANCIPARVEAMHEDRDAGVVRVKCVGFGEVQVPRGMVKNRKWTEIQQLAATEIENWQRGTELLKDAQT